ncbi:GNAT family N-acetyltransferase [Dyadobacter fanqingshengii]|uniref:GNAT family N-acetyltransferase n=1 Tax=Dyadobacter fanqingshengii TaxID=2906443 RepID=A0A9X1PGG4_9BACT|nr:GNAT family N-acetyltransferase [Dyadobacter fanqingshengii]MCF0043634.1 GNAT family N-acetyltransferase [Dyadobacter fanqingshengii]USJ34750.1 GNAT family N-acetyltransferase [Dyadobacter fanqingshengii]
MKTYVFRSTDEAKNFCLNIGIERSFIFSPMHQEIKSSVAILCFKKSGQICAVIIVYQATNEVGLWVRPEHRNKGLGSSVFAKGMNRLNKKRRIKYAYIDDRDDISARAMRRILCQNEFLPLIVGEDNGTCQLWSRLQ